LHAEESSRDSHGTQKGFRIIPHGCTLSLEFLRAGAPQREGVSCCLVGVRAITDDRPSQLGEQPCKLRRDARVLVT
jgi:hypothetical protein